ncbi:hypothetical protein TRFO_29119 [Tritrichomonas foetus]|uniref:F5/8 type C domain-containing protein n=1 Tax=Tritrichomonas foetus TaxID=1144522 RepID=A0A1J4JWI9_9EUKA|nr:hypothetical protein TRFO_29119 [Tritrichomonas foetus]|eukprot:OHT03511.1 hypothetical protein TRFO_29119 [Tritrichomonas foetus]
MLLSPPLPASDPPNNDFILSCNGIDYEINKNLFANISKHFSNLTNSLSTQIVHVSVRYPQHVFSSFVDACQQRPFILNLDDLKDFRTLCREWDAPNLEKYVKTLTKQVSISNVPQINKSPEFHDLQEQINQLATIIEKQQKEIERLKTSRNEREEVQAFFEKQITELKKQNANHSIIQSPTFSSHRAKVINFTGEPLRGLIFWLRQQIHQTLQESGLIHVSASTTSSLFSSSPYMLLEDNQACKWFSENRKHQWLKIDFIDRVVEVSGYTIRTHIGHMNFWFLRNWKLEGSTDDIEWEVIDEHRMNDVLDENVSMCTWTCFPKGPFRYLKFTQTGKNHNGDNYFMLSGIEIFGKLQQRPPFFV